MKGGPRTFCRGWGDAHKASGRLGHHQPQTVVGVLTLLRCLNQLSQGLSVCSWGVSDIPSGHGPPTSPPRRPQTQPAHRGPGESSLQDFSGHSQGLRPAEPTLLRVSQHPGAPLWGKETRSDLSVNPSSVTHRLCVTLTSHSASLSLVSCLPNGANKQFPSDRTEVGLKDINEAVAVLGLAQAPEGLEKVLRPSWGPGPQKQDLPLGGTPQGVGECGGDSGHGG